MYLARELTDASLPAIGREFGGRNHSTVMHAHRRIKANLITDAATARAVDGVRCRLSGTDADRTSCDNPQPPRRDAITREPAPGAG
jgi:hypothetical protein